MSITKSYNKHTNTYYAYETTYEWDDTKQKKVQRKHCIGQFDPDTGEIMPNGKVGRPGRATKTSAGKLQATPMEKKEQDADVKALAFRLSKIEETLLMLSEEIHSMREEIDRNLSGIRLDS